MVAIGNPVYDEIITPTRLSHGRILSGCSTNACLAASKLGLRKTAIVGTIGRDYAEHFASTMRAYGVETFLDVSSERTGGFKLVYDERGRRTLQIIEIGAKIGVDMISKELLDSKFILFGPILSEIDIELIKHVTETTDAQTFLDPQGLLRKPDTDGRVRHISDSRETMNILETFDFVKPNEFEARILTGENDAVRCLRKLVSFGPAVTIVTLAEKGSILHDGRRLVRIPAYPTKAVDPTGAGDVYAGAFIFRYVNSGSVVESAAYASAAASIMVEHIGPDFPLTDEDATRRLAAIRSKVIRDASELY